MQTNDNELKPVKLEQPYSVIRMHNDGDDPNKLKSWERPPHNSSKITKQNLDDAMAVNNVFKDSIDSGNSLQAPEGNSNDYFLKAKDNLVSKTNDRKIGDFLNQFHGMDFFKSGVPEIEKGLKGTGYDMGPSANIVDNLKEAVDKGDTKEVENIIEEHPEESQKILPEDTPIQEEAEQITDDTNKANDEVNNEVVEDFVEDNQSELAPVGYTTEQVTDPNVGSIPEDLPENNRPLDNFVLNNYDDDTDRGELSPANNDNKDDVTTETDTDSSKDEDDEFEAYARKAGEEAGDRKQLEKEHKEAFEEKLRHNNQEAWKDYALEKGKLNTRGSIRKGFEKEVGKSLLAEIMTPEEWMNDSLREGVLRHTNYTSDPVVIRNRLRESIAKEKKALGIDEETLRAKEEAKRQEEAKRKEEEKKRRDEAWAKLTADDKGKDKDNKKVGSSFINVPPDSEDGIDWDKVKVYKPGEDATVYGIQQEPFDPRVEENLNYDYDQNIPQEASITDTELPDVVDYGLEDQNQYGDDLLSEDETIIDDTMANTEPLSDDNFEPTPEAPYADNVVQLKQQKEQLDKELEEAEAEPVTDKESAIKKQNRVKMARAAIANFHASNPNFNNLIQQSDGSTATGGRVSPRAGIGSIGGGASGHGSMSPTNSRRTNNAMNTGKAAGGGSMPVTLGANSSKVIQPSRSFSNGSLSSGSFGLMSKNKSNGAFSSKPVSLPNGESSSVVEGLNVDSITESGKNALIERLKTLLDKLSPEQRKQLGFSPKDYNYQGERLEDLDGYTIQKLLEEVGKLVGSF